MEPIAHGTQPANRFTRSLNVSTSRRPRDNRGIFRRDEIFVEIGGYKRKMGWHSEKPHGTDTLNLWYSFGQTRRGLLIDRQYCFFPCQHTHMHMPLNHCSSSRCSGGSIWCVPHVRCRKARPRKLCPGDALYVIAQHHEEIIKMLLWGTLSDRIQNNNLT